MSMGYLLMRGSFTCLPSGPHTADYAYTCSAPLRCSLFAATVPTPEQTYAVSRFSLWFFRHIDRIAADTRV